MLPRQSGSTRLRHSQQLGASCGRPGQVGLPARLVKTTLRPVAGEVSTVAGAPLSGASRGADGAAAFARREVKQVGSGQGPRTWARPTPAPGHALSRRAAWLSVTRSW